ncbi:FtsX-like permease family [uncultured Clostridium sp.]|nr:FtsX-like permease family [uncultured Clostridium sp.]
MLSLFFIFFISYSSRFFIEQRKKEFGIYTFMGVENNKIAFLFTQEGLLIGIVALVGGILGGDYK